MKMEDFQGTILDIQWAPWEYGAAIAVVCSGGTLSIRTLNLESRTYTNTFLEVLSQGACTCVSWSPAAALTSLITSNHASKFASQHHFNTPRLAVGCSDGTVRIVGWNKGSSGESLLQVLQVLTCRMKNNISLDPLNVSIPNLSDRSANSRIFDVVWRPSLGLPMQTLVYSSADGTLAVWISPPTSVLTGSSSALGAPGVASNSHAASNLASGGRKTESVWHLLQWSALASPAVTLSFNAGGTLLAACSGADVCLLKETRHGLWVPTTSLDKDGFDVPFSRMSHLNSTTNQHAGGSTITQTHNSMMPQQQPAQGNLLNAPVMSNPPLVTSPQPPLPAGLAPSANSFSRTAPLPSPPVPNVSISDALPADFNQLNVTVPSAVTSMNASLPAPANSVLVHSNISNRSTAPPVTSSPSFLPPPQVPLQALPTSVDDAAAIFESLSIGGYKSQTNASSYPATSAVPIDVSKIAQQSLASSTDLIPVTIGSAVNLPSAAAEVAPTDATDFFTSLMAFSDQNIDENRNASATPYATASNSNFDYQQSQSAQNQSTQPPREAPGPIQSNEADNTAMSSADIANLFASIGQQ